MPCSNRNPTVSVSPLSFDSTNTRHVPPSTRYRRGVKNTGEIPENVSENPRAVTEQSHSQILTPLESSRNALWSSRTPTATACQLGNPLGPATCTRSRNPGLRSLRGDTGRQPRTPSSQSLVHQDAGSKHSGGQATLAHRRHRTCICFHFGLSVRLCTSVLNT